MEKEKKKRIWLDAIIEFASYLSIHPPQFKMTACHQRSLLITYVVHEGGLILRESTVQFKKAGNK